jgi:type II secretory pathway pseudopilin PulG
MARFPWQKAPESEGSEGFTLPDELVTQIKAGSEAASKLGKVEQMLADLSTIVKTDADERKAAKEEEARQRLAAARVETDDTLEEQIETLMLAGKTKQAIALATSGQTTAIKAIHAEQVKKDLFEDQDKFKYYHGDIKREVDSLLANQPVEFRMKPENIQNCYDTIIGKHHEQILEGKIKTRFASGSGGNTASGSAGDSGTGGNKVKPPITDDVRKAARAMGFDPEKYADMLIEEGIGYA